MHTISIVHGTVLYYNLIQFTSASRSMIYRPNFGAGGDPSRRVSGAPPAPPPGLESGQGVYRRDRPIQIVSLGKSYAPAPCPVSHLHAAAAVRAGSVPEITQGYKY